MVTVQVLGLICLSLVAVVAYLVAIIPSREAAARREVERQLKLERLRSAEAREMYEDRICRLRAGISDVDPLPYGVTIEGGVLRAGRRWLSMEDQALIEKQSKEMH